ncbi:hypothetical protein, partial [Shimia sp. SDUM112013]|uniref:calcium-binding protein n=1 Tax=Shimia sp. SDUM112013 TaxID=3136160 RepID=UPI0032ECE599
MPIFPGTENSEVLNGTASDDTLFGNGGADTISGLEGNDILSANGANNEGTTYDGGDGNDTLIGSAGNETLRGGAGDDRLEGGAGNDVIETAGGGHDRIIGGAGYDFLYLAPDPAGGFVTIDYSGLGGPVSADLRYGVIEKPGGDQDEWYNLHEAFELGATDGGRLIGTAHNDTFTTHRNPFDRGMEMALEIIGGQGSDNYHLGHNGLVRLNFSVDEQGQAATQALVVDLDTGVISNDGFGNQEQITGSSPLEIIGTTFADQITLGWETSYQMGAGNDIVTGLENMQGAVRYDAAPTTGVTVNLALRMANGLWNGQAFTHTLLDIENVAGSEAGNDHLEGNSDDNELYGLGGDDTLDGRTGNDTLDGGAGDDTFLALWGDNTLIGGAGTDTVIVDANSSEIAVTAALSSGTYGDILGDAVTMRTSEGFQTLFNSVEIVQFNDLTLTYAEIAARIWQIGGIPADTIWTGTEGADVGVSPINANSLLNGLGGDDELMSNGGANGHDTLIGGAGHDTLIGQNGNDVLVPGPDGGIVRAGRGDDIIDLRGSDSWIDIHHWDLFSAIRVDIDAVADTGLISKGERSVDGHTALLGVGDTMDHFLGIAGTFEDDVFNITMRPGSTGTLFISPNSGSDRINFFGQSDMTVIMNYGGNGANNGVVANLQTGIVSNDGHGDADIIGQTTVLWDFWGTVHGDYVSGDAQANHFDGSDGNDTLIGLAGNDTLTGGEGADILNGGADNDTARYFEQTEALTVNLAAGTASGGQADGDVLTSIESVIGGLGRNHLTGDANFNHLRGRTDSDFLNGQGGDDLLEGGGNADTLVGGGGNDTLLGGGGDPSEDPTLDLRDVIYGGNGNDSIDGGYGNDELRGDAGDDSIAGGFGADTVIGGTGDDVLTGSAFGDVIFGGDGNDFINGGFGHDRV